MNAPTGPMMFSEGKGRSRTAPSAAGGTRLKARMIASARSASPSSSRFCFSDMSATPLQCDLSVAELGDDCVHVDAGAVLQVRLQPGIDELPAGRRRRERPGDVAAVHPEQL